MIIKRSPLHTGCQVQRSETNRDLLGWGALTPGIADPSGLAAPRSRMVSPMQVLVRHDNTISGGERLSTQVTASVEAALERFSSHITRAEVHFADENGPKGGDDDIRCTIEIRVEGRQPVAVTEHSSSLDLALDGAVEKVVRMLEHQLDRQREHHRSGT
jgi:ribosome-associated translation inhibitor RaiA